MQGQNGKGEQPAGINEGKQRGPDGTERPASHHRILHFTNKGNHDQKDRGGKRHQKRKGNQERGILRRGDFPELGHVARPGQQHGIRRAEKKAQVRLGGFSGTQQHVPPFPGGQDAEDADQPVIPKFTVPPQGPRQQTQQNHGAE